MNTVKQKLKQGKVVVGTWMQIPSKDVAEIIASSNFDFCAVDMEHTEIDMKVTSEIFSGLQKSQCIPAARVSSNTVMDIRKPLDLGAQIIIVPLVNGEEDARNAVHYAKYPPEGVRGFAFCRANNWGKDFDEYVKSINEEILVFAMVESRDAVEHIDEILSVEGIDGVFVGPYDLSGSFGIVGQTDHPVIKKSLKKVVDACKLHNKVAGQHIVLPTEEAICTAIEQGYKFIVLGIDAVFMRQGLDRCKEIVESVE